MLLLVLLLLLYPLGALVEGALSRTPTTDWGPVVLFRRLLLGLLLVAWGAVSLAQVGRFNAALVLVAVAAVVAALAAWHLSRGSLAAALHAGRWQRRRELAALGALLALAAALFAHPGEDVLGARDPGIYFATGLAIARGGAVLQHDPALAALGANLGDESLNYWLFQSVHGWPLRFPGQLFARDLTAGTVEPGFLPWYPALLALAAGLAGPAAALWVNPLLSVLAVAAVYLVGRAAVGALAAWLGALLLCLNLGQVWFARYTMAEPSAQLLVWTGLLAMVAAARHASVAAGLLAGLAWGGLFLARIDAVLLLPPVVAYLAWHLHAPRQRPWALPALALTLLGAAQAGAHAWLLAPGYASMTFSRATLAVAAGGIVLALVLAALAWSWAAGWRPRRRAWQLAVLLLVVVAGGLFAYAARPVLPAAALTGEAAELEAASRESLVRLGWYVTPWGLLLAAFGATALVVGGRWRRAPLPWALLALSLAFYLPNPLVSSDHPWAVRRYLPVVLPALLLLGALGAVALARWLAARSRLVRRWRRALALALVAPVAWGQWQAVSPLVAYREHAGALEQTRALAARLPSDALTLFPRSGAGMRLATPLHYLGQRASFVLPADGFEAGVVPVIERWLADGRTVYWIVPRGTRFPTPPGLRLLPAGEFQFAVPQLERPIDRLPSVADPLVFDLQLFRLALEPAPN